MKRKKILIIGSLIIVFLVLFSFYKVDVKDYAVITQFGKPIVTRSSPGLYLKWPEPIQTVNRFDKRLQIYKTRLIEYLTSDRKNFIFQCFVCWRIVEPLKFFQSVGSKLIGEEKLDDLVSAQLGIAIGETPMKNIISTNEKEIKLSDIEQTITSKVDKKATENYGISVVSVGIGRLALPQSNAQSVFERMRAEREAMAAQYRAEGKKESTKIKSEAEREKSFILSKAYKEAEITKGQGDAKAATIYASAYKKDPEFYQFWRTLQSYPKIFDHKSTIVLSTDSEFLKYLEHKK